MLNQSNQRKIEISTSQKNLFGITPIDHLPDSIDTIMPAMINFRNKQYQKSNNLRKKIKKMHKKQGLWEFCRIEAKVENFWSNANYQGSYWRKKLLGHKLTMSDSPNQSPTWIIAFHTKTKVLSQAQVVQKHYNHLKQSNSLLSRQMNFHQFLHKIAKQA